MGALRTAVFAMSLALLAPGAVEAQRFGGGGYGFDPSRLQGQDVGAAQGDLSGRGFIKARNIRIGAQQWDLWYNDRDRKGCVGFTSYNGRITEARTFEDSECGRDNASNPPPGRPGFDIDRLRKMNVPTAQRSLIAEGFSKARNMRVSGAQWDLWSNRRDRNSCVGFTSYYGIVTDVRPFGDRDCGDDAGGDRPNPPGRDFDLPRLNGLRVNAAQQSLASDGFEHARNIKIDGKQWDLWFNDRYRNPCIGFTSYSGLVTGTRTFGERDCN